MKHALWMALLRQLTRKTAPLQVLDTHAGAGIYALDGDMARRSGEAVRGIGRLAEVCDAPAAFADLRAAVAAENRPGAVKVYPGSPLLSLWALRAGDQYVGCELREDDYEALDALLKARRRREGPIGVALRADGYGEMASAAPRTGVQSVVLIDPPYERGDERNQLLEAIAVRLSIDAACIIALWAPIKDLESLDSILRGLEALDPHRLQVAELRLRPLTDPLKMNGSAMIFINAPDLTVSAQETGEWLAQACGDPGAAVRVRTLTSPDARPSTLGA